MSVVKDKKNKKFYISYKLKQPNGSFKTINIRNKEWTLDVGIRYMRSIEDDIIEKDKAKRLAKQEATEELTLEELIEIFFRVRDAEGFTLNTEVAQKNFFKKYLFKFCKPNQPLSKTLKTNIVDKINIEMTKNNLQTISRNQYLGFFRTLIIFAKKRKYIDRVLADDVVDLIIPARGTNNTSNNFFVHGEDDLRAFEHSFDNEDREYKIVFMTMFYGALRVSELRALKVKSLNFEDNTIAINSQYNNREHLVNRTKNKNERTIILPSAFMKELEAYVKEKKLTSNEFLFQNKLNTNCISQRTINDIFNKHVKAIGLPQMTLHGLRHSFATRMFDKGYDVKEVQQHLGHLNMNTTMGFYIHYTQNKKDNSHDDLL